MENYSSSCLSATGKPFSRKELDLRPVAACVQSDPSTNGAYQASNRVVVKDLQRVFESSPVHGATSSREGFALLHGNRFVVHVPHAILRRQLLPKCRCDDSTYGLCVRLPHVLLQQTVTRMLNSAFSVLTFNMLIISGTSAVLERTPYERQAPARTQILNVIWQGRSWSQT